MKYNKEVIYHFSCEKCVNWWSYPSSEELVKAFHDSKIWHCPHCGHKNKPPHTDQDEISPISDSFVQTFRENA